MVGPLKNQRHELFAHAIANGMTADAAYAEAGYEPHRGNASRMSANESIRARVADLQGQAADRTIERVALTDADFINRLVREADHYGEGSSHGARVQAVRLIGDHLGLLRARIEHSTSNGLDRLILEINKQGSTLPLTATGSHQTPAQAWVEPADTTTP